MKKYNVLTVTPFFPPGKGGIHNHVLNLTRNLTELGNSLSIITPKQGEDIPSQYFGHFKKVSFFQILSNFERLYLAVPTSIFAKNFSAKFRTNIYRHLKSLSETPKTVIKIAKVRKMTS